MLKFDETEIMKISDKYREEVLNKMANPSFSILEENNLHTSMLADCSRGSAVAKKYVIDKIYEILSEIVTDNDKKILLEEIAAELKVFNEKQYERENFTKISDNQEQSLSYYELIEVAGNEHQHKLLEDFVKRANDFSLGIKVLANELYKQEYGIGKLDDIYEMRLNNIEVHDTHKIRVELADGNWYTISDRRIDSDELVKTYAKRLLSQNAGGDLTDDDCERESSLIDGSRITIALKPASTLDTIFIKKFDTFTITTNDMLKNGTVTDELLGDMKILAKGRSNAVFIGGVNTGKSTVLKMYVGLIPTKYKIGLVDPSKDTDLITLYPDKDVIILYETANYSMNDQFSKLLRMNRDIMGISEARSYEVEQAIKGMLRGNSGSFLTLHTTKMSDVVDNIAWMCLENGISQDMRVLRSRIASAIDIVYRVKHFNNGARRIDEVCEMIATGNLEKPFEEKKIYEWDYKNNTLIRNPNYIPSDILIEKLKYYGCTDEEIERFKRC